MRAFHTIYKLFHLSKYIIQLLCLHYARNNDNRELENMAFASLMTHFRVSETSKVAEMRGLTGMRGIAACYVLVAHLAYFHFIPQTYATLNGSTGVDFFFVLSGYLLYKLYATKGTSKGYFAKRIFRTFPLYYLTLPLYFVTKLAIVSPQIFFYVQNYSPSTFSESPIWTLALEELFYFLLLPLIVKFKINKIVLLIVGVGLTTMGFALPRTAFFNLQIWNFFIDYAIGIAITFLTLKTPKALKIEVIGLFAACMILGLIVPGTPAQAIFAGPLYGMIILCFQKSRFFTNRL